MIPHLFVYGSLMSRAGHRMGRRLAREARCLGEASLRGRLYTISWYPGLVDAGGEDDRVWGEVFRLDDPARALAWLDAYEGITPGSPARGEYARLQRSVRLATGAELSAWVYVYRRDVAGLRPVPGGRWMPQPR